MAEQCAKKSIKDCSIMDYVIYQKDVCALLRFSDGDIVIYGDLDEAIEDCRQDGTDYVIPIK